MKLRVQRRDGRIETIDLVGQVRVREGGELSHAESEDGVDHYFWPDGYYDGWGGAVAGSKEDAEQMIQRIERERRVDED